MRGKKEAHNAFFAPLCEGSYFYLYCKLSALLGYFDPNNKGRKIFSPLIDTMY